MTSVKYFSVSTPYCYISNTSSLNKISNNLLSINPLQPLTFNIPQPPNNPPLHGRWPPSSISSSPIMNNSAATGGFLGSDNIGGFGYGIGVSVGILLLITTITLASYYCTRNSSAVFVLPQRNPRAAAHPPDHTVEVGLDEATLTSYPKLLFSEAKVNHKDSTAACCSICLADYKSSDIIRVLPDCGHLFHVKCVDPWLRLHPTCPVCRTSPMPTPLSTPLQEVVPLATRPMG